MTKPLLIAASVALALSVAACGRDDRADATRTAPGAHVVTTPPPSAPVDAAGSASGGTTGMGAGGMTSGGSTASGAPSMSAPGPDQTGGPGSAYGTQSATPPTGTPSTDAGAGSMSR